MKYEINIAPISILSESARIFFSTTEKEGYDRVYRNQLPINFPTGKLPVDLEFAWWSKTGAENDIPIDVDLFKNKRFVKSYFNRLLYRHFEAEGMIMGRNFISDTEVYLEDGNFQERDYSRYKKYFLKIDNGRIVRDPGVLISRDKSTYILSRPLSDVDVPGELLGKVLYKGKIQKYSDLDENSRKDGENIFPVLNLEIRHRLSIPIRWAKPQNKYKDYYFEIASFFNEHLKEKEVAGEIKFLSTPFQELSSSRITHTADDSNLLIFGNNRTNFVPYTGLKENGPLAGPRSQKIEFFFIFHAEDKGFANRLYSFLKKGFKSFPGIFSFARIPFELNDSMTIRFSEANPIPEIEEQLSEFNFDPDTKYAAFYISRIKKNSDDKEADSYYFRLKELLITKNVTSQVVYRDNIDNDAFNFYLPNISIAVLAKLGGVPWRLFRPIKNDLIIGIGADRSQENKTRFIGSAMCFKNDGNFKGFNVFEEGDLAGLSTAIEQAIADYVEENKEFDRLVLHYYKSLSGKEEDLITKALHRMKTNVPYVVLTINEVESRDYVVFDSLYEGKMPQSGTVIQLNNGEFLLCNNTRYAQQTGTRIDGFPFPIKIRIRTSANEKIRDLNSTSELIDQVYQFSRMYFKSVRQGNMPVTIEYSKIIAETVGHFQNKELGQFGRDTLWFL